MEEIKIIVGGVTATFDVPEDDEEIAQAQICIFLMVKGVAMPLDRKVRLVVIRDGELRIV